jgi:vacuolar-type H+-ATPase subunit H
MDISSILDEMVEHAITQFEERKEEIEQEQKDTLSRMQSEYETTKYQSLQSYYQFIYSSLDPFSEEYQTIMKRFPIFPEQFLEELCKKEQQYKKEVEKVELKLLHHSNALEMKHAETLRQIEQLRSTVPQTTAVNSSWFSVFDSDDSDEEEDKEK